MKESSSRGCIKGFPGILAKNHVKMLKKYRVFNGKVRASDDESLKWSHIVPRDSSSSCLKFRTFFRRLTTLEMWKKHKQNLEHNVFQFPCKLPTVWLYQCLAFSVKENGNNFHLKVFVRHASDTQACTGLFKLLQVWVWVFIAFSREGLIPNQFY